MQKLNLSTKTRAGLAGLTDLAAVQALPHENAPVRLPSFPNLERTSVLSLERNFTFGAGATGVTTSQRMALTRSVGCPLWNDRLVPVAEVYGFVTDVFDLATVAVVEDPPFVASMPMAGGCYPVGHDGTDYYFLSPSQGVTPITFPLVVESVGGDCSVNFIYGTGSDGVYRHWSTIVSAVAVPLAIPSGYWFRITSIEIGPVDVPGLRRVCVSLDPAIAVGNRRFLLPVGYPLEIENSLIPYEDSRCTANAVLLSNVTKVLNKEGTVQAARLTPKVNGPFGPWSFSATHLSDVHPAERYFGALEQGVYTFTASTQESEFFHPGHYSMADLSAWPDTLSGESRYHGTIEIGSSPIFNAILLVDNDASTSSLMAATHTYHLEYRTSSALFPSGYSLVPLENYHASQLALLQTGFFFENPMHWTDLASLLLRGIRMAAPIVAPNLAAPISLAATALQAVLPKKNRTANMSQASFAPKPKKARGKQRPRRRSSSKTKSRKRRVRVRRPRK